MTIFWSTVIRSFVKLILYFSKNMDQAYSLWRWRPLRCAISLPRSSARTRQTNYLLCQVYSQVSKWATYSKQLRRLPVVIDQYWQSFSPLSAANSDTRGRLWSLWRSYRPRRRDLKKDERITIQHKSCKGEETWQGPVGEDSILYPQIV